MAKQFSVSVTDKQDRNVKCEEPRNSRRTGSLSSIYFERAPLHDKLQQYTEPKWEPHSRASSGARKMKTAPQKSAEHFQRPSIAGFAAQLVSVAPTQS